MQVIEQQVEIFMDFSKRHIKEHLKRYPFIEIKCKKPKMLYQSTYIIDCELYNPFTHYTIPIGFSFILTDDTSLLDVYICFESEYKNNRTKRVSLLNHSLVEINRCWLSFLKEHKLLITTSLEKDTAEHSLDSFFLDALFQGDNDSIGTVIARNRIQLKDDSIEFIAILDKTEQTVLFFIIHPILSFRTTKLEVAEINGIVVELFYNKSNKFTSFLEDYIVFYQDFKEEYSFNDFIRIASGDIIKTNDRIRFLKENNILTPKKVHYLLSTEKCKRCIEEL